MKTFYFSLTFLTILFLTGCSEQTTITDQTEISSEVITGKTAPSKLPTPEKSQIIVNSASKNPATGAWYYTTGIISYSYIRLSGKFELVTNISLTVKEVLLKRVTIFSVQDITKNSGISDNKKGAEITNSYRLTKDAKDSPTLYLVYQISNEVTLESTDVR
ncbi:MAG: hypothetical protein EPO24_08875 [Bacteroidetes bacterium]|nr:MAG: hypothetical protein EPO24_08875 [Bacteroidota bacterium]